MTSVLNVDTIAAKNGTSPVALTAQESAKVVIAADTDASIHRSLNVSSSTEHATGDFSYNLTNAFSVTTMQQGVTACCLGYQDIVRVMSARASTSVLDIEVINTSAVRHAGGQGIAVFGVLA